MQLLLLNQAYAFEKKEVGDKIHFALQDVVQKIYRDNKTNLPINNQIKKVTEDYYIVNVDDVFEAEVLEYYLKTEFQKVKLDVDFEYAIYDCASDEMMYGSYISSNVEQSEKCENCFEKKEGLIYYFAIRFPQLKYSLIGSLGQYWFFTGILLLVLVIYVYSVFQLLRQKKYAELQTDFINNMTHEFKTPLASILIASNYTQNQPEIKNNPKLSKYTDIIITQSQKLNQHIERILTVAKGDGKWIELDKKPIALKEMIELIKENVLLKTNKQSAISIEIPVQQKVMADEFHFYNTLFNLIENAIKYSGDSPEILIQTTETAKGLDISIADNGPGIEKIHIENVFDKFYRVPREDKKDIEGFGIGLSYVKKIIDLHYWKIKLENNLKGGLTVFISVPKKDCI
ncbi:sensor histidine kinase [Flavobacterium orientale]|uniref:histidine kinase n=1 Tax=Flavobacterium orientale TaxID=1756020 RepID=A0A917DAM0_9FLAO|nr:HAMP domain-containing sensor histidine kinase [Flavobacterium orientale]GGD23284.1 two-component sensor histidine kinase [Flavobacterium orientale]